MTATITPKNALNTLIIEGFAHLTGNNDATGIGIFQDATVSAIAASVAQYNTDGIRPLPFYHKMVAGTVAATTFNIRAGCNTPNAYFNGISSGRKYGGVLVSELKITEISV